MAGVEERIAELAAHAPLGVALALAVLLGVRHATDPDHLAALATLTAAECRGRRPLSAGMLGLSWGLGHGLVLVSLGVPTIFLGAHLPASVQRGAEAAVGIVIVVLALHLLRRWRRAALHVHVHAHPGGTHHAHVHAHADDEGHAHAHEHPPRSPLTAFAIGGLHGIGGSAAVSVLLVASITSPVVATASLALVAGGSAGAMAALSTGLGLALLRARGTRILEIATPCLAVGSLAFGGWYALAVL